MAESWIDIEDQPEIIDAEVEELIEQLESEQTIQPTGEMMSVAEIDDSEPEPSDSSDDEEDHVSFFRPR